MAKAYRARRDVSFPRVLSSTGEGDNLFEAVEGTLYPAGSIVQHDTLTARDKERIESGDLEHLLDPISDEEADQAARFGDGVEPDYGVFVAEHEAEAHALREYGHHVIPKEQQLEALSAGAEHAARYQQAVKEAGYDQRPAQEFFGQEHERVPDEVLYGAETPAGVPHNRGPVQQQGGEGQNSEEERADGEQQAVRPRPGQAVGPEAPASEQGSAENPGTEAQGV